MNLQVNVREIQIQLARSGQTLCQTLPSVHLLGSVEGNIVVARSVFAGCLEVPTAKHHSAIFVQGSKGRVSRRVTLMLHMFTQKKRGSLKLRFIIRYFFSFFFPVREMNLRSVLLKQFAI